MRQKTLHLRCSVALLLAVLFFTAGCSRTDQPLFSNRLPEIESEQPASPQFWEYALPVSGCKNLYELHNDFFDGRPYNDLETLGSNILFIGQAYYSELTFDELEASGMDMGALEYQYSFELYSPWNNEVIAALAPEDIQCDSYQVVGDRLLLLDMDKKEISFYDDTLQFINRYDISKFYEDCDLTFYASGSPDVMYTCGNTENVLLELTFLPETIQIQKHSLPFLDASLNDVSPDGSRLLFSGVDTLSLGYRTYVVDSDTWKIVDTFPGTSYFVGDISSNAVLSDTNYNAGYWVYQNIGEPSAYFYWPDARDAALLPDESMILSIEEYDDASTSRLLSYYRYAPTGKILSSFTYDYGNSYSDSGPYIGNHFAYMEDLDVCFLLLYTLDAQPYLIVWDLTSETATLDDNPLGYYSDELQLAQNHPYSYDGENPADTGQMYGSTVTLIDDPESYDWGDLADVDARANALEAQYGVSIYLGPEIPEMIDCFYTAQETSPTVLDSALDELSRILSCYPENFFSQLCFGENRGIHIYLTGTITSDTPGMLESPSGFVNEINSYMVMVLDVEYAWDWDYTVNHEFSHMIDRRLEFRNIYYEDSLYSEEIWSSLNPPEHEYLYTYDNYKDYPLYGQNPEYYISAYGLTYPTEDRAEMYGTAMQDYLDDFAFYKGEFRGTQPIAEKYRYYCKCIREGFETTGWEDTMPWEKVFSE